MLWYVLVGDVVKVCGIINLVDGVNFVYNEYVCFGYFSSVKLLRFYNVVCIKVKLKEYDIKMFCLVECVVCSMYKFIWLLRSGKLFCIS